MEYGLFGEYGLSSDWWAGNGLGLELLGFLVVSVGNVLLGRALRRDSGVGIGKFAGIAAVGLASPVLGGH